MKCKYCGAEIGLEDPFCKYCGKPNEAARQHISDMEHYKADYSRTKAAVNQRVNFFASWVSRLVILIALVVACIVFIILGQKSWEFPRMRREREAVRNEEAFSARIDSYLEEGDYYALAEFYRYYELYQFPGKGHYEKYLSLDSPLFSYRDVMENMYDLAYGDRDLYDPSQTARCLEDFYGYTDPARIGTSGTDSEETSDMLSKACAGMREDVRNCLIVYCGITEEDADLFPTYTDGKRLSLLEEGVNHAKEN